MTYEELLDVFWSSHNPVSPAYSSQYRSVVFYHNEEQKQLAMQSRSNQAMRLGTRVFVEIVPAETFYPAEDYHQKYRLRQQSQILQEYQAIYPQIGDFVASTAVARVNGYLGSYGSCERLREEHLGSLGLSQEGRDRLQTLVCGTSRR